MSDQVPPDRQAQPPGSQPDPPGWQSQPPGWQPQPPGWQPQPPGWQGGGLSRFEAPKPGCVPLRPLGVGDILDGSFRVIRRNPRTTLGLSAIIGVVQVAITSLLQVLSLHQLGQLDVLGADNSNASTNLGPLLGGEFTAFMGLVVSTLLGAVLTGMLTVVVTQDVLGVKMGLSDVWTKVRGRMWALVGISVTTTILEFLGLIPCFVLGVWLWGIWAVAVPAMMVEGKTIRGALGRSKQLVDGSFWRVWGIRALGAMMITVVSGIASVPFELLGLAVSGTGLDGLTHGQVPISFLLITAVGSLIATTFTAPVRAAIDSLLYVDLRMRKEGLDIVLQQASARPPA